ALPICRTCEENCLRLTTFETILTQSSMRVYRVARISYSLCIDSHLKNLQAAFCCVSEQRGGVSHGVIQRHWASGERGNCGDAQLVHGLIPFSEAARKRKDWEIVAPGQLCHGPNTFAISCLLVNLPLRRNNQVGRTNLLLKMNRLQHNLRPWSQCGMDECQQARSQAASSSRAGNCGDGAPQVSFDDMRVMGQSCI